MILQTYDLPTYDLAEATSIITAKLNVFKNTALTFSAKIIKLDKNVHDFEIFLSVLSKKISLYFQTKDSELFDAVLEFVYYHM